MMHRSLLAGAALLTFCLAASTSAGAVPFELHSDVVYGHKMGMALTYDVLDPVRGNGAGIAFMVSGGWVSTWFDPSMVVQRFGALSQLLEKGYTVYLVRHGSSPLFKVPDAVMDVRLAIAHIRENADNYGVDPQRLGVFGGSAGGHLSLMLGAASESEVGTSGTGEQSRVAAVVAYFPPVDLQPIVGPNDRFPALDFASELADDISPLLYVSDDDPPTLLVHGTADPLVPQSTSEAIHAAFQEKGVVTKLVLLDGAGHGFQGDHEARATAELIDWFDTHLVAEAEAAASVSPE